MAYSNNSIKIHGLGLAQFGESPTMTMSLSASDISRNGNTISCTVNATLNAMSGIRYFGYYVNVYAQLDNGSLVQLISKPNLPNQWNSGSYGLGSKTVSSTNTTTSSTLKIYLESNCQCATGNVLVHSVSMTAPSAVTYYTVSYNANGGSNPPAAQTKASNANLTLTTSKPTAPSVTLTFNANGGSVSTSSKSYSKAFSIWNTNSSGTGTNYNPGGTFTTNANTTLYAIWSAATVSGLPTPSKSGSVFVGWFTAVSGGTQITNNSKLSSNTTVYARWQSTYTVSYNANGGSGAPASQTKYHGTNLTLTTAKPSGNKKVTVTFNPNGGTVSPTSTTKECSFVRWNTNAAGTGTSYNSGGTYSANANATLYAQWSSPSVGTLPTPTRSQCIFVDWYTAVNGGSKVASTSAFKDSATIYARWNYIIKYDLNGGTVGDSGGTSVPDDVKQHQVNLSLTGIRPIKNDLVFLGWSESKTATSATYQPGQAYTKDEPKTLYAVYGVPSYTVKFDLNGGTYTGGGQLTQTVKLGGNAVLPNNPTKTDHTFKGWIGSPNNITRDTVITALWNGSPVWIVKSDRKWHSYLD